MPGAASQGLCSQAEEPRAELALCHSTLSARPLLPSQREAGIPLFHNHRSPMAMPSTTSHLPFPWKSPWGQTFRVFLQTQTDKKAFQKRGDCIFRHPITSPSCPEAHHSACSSEQHSLLEFPCARVLSSSHTAQEPQARVLGSEAAHRAGLWTAGMTEGCCTRVHVRHPRHESRKRGLVCAADALPRVCQVCCWRSAQALEKEFPWQNDFGTCKWAGCAMTGTLAQGSASLAPSPCASTGQV